MKFGSFAKHAEKMIADNSPAILTAIGAAGAVFTAYLVGKASFRAAEIIAEETAKVVGDADTVEEAILDTRAKIELVWKEYVPAVVMCAISVAAIIGSNHISTRRAAALAGAYSLSEKAFAEYKEKVLKTVGENKERRIRDDLAQDQANRNPPPPMVIIGSGNQLCRETYTNQYFMSTVEDIKAAVNKVNNIINTEGSSDLAEFYSFLDIPWTKMSTEVGWNLDKLLEVEYSAVLVEGGKPCISIDFRTIPYRGSHKFG